MSNFEALRADVTFVAETGQAKIGIEQLRREFHSSTGQMSTDALRAAVAQEKLDKAIARHGPSSTQAKQAELAYRREVEATTRAANQETAALDRTQREMGQVSRGALTGSGAMRGFARSAALMSATFLGSAGVVYGIRKTLDAAKESQVVLGQTENAVERAGLSWRKYGDRIQEAALAQANLSGFDDERLLRTFSLFVRITKDVNEALSRNALAANIARGRNIELEAAAQLVVKASLGQAGALRRVGIDAAKTASATQLLALLQDKFGASAAKYATTAQGAQDRFNVALGNTEELIGTALLPQVTKYLDSGAKWLSQTDNQERIQRDVNKAVQFGGDVLGGLASGIEHVDAVLGPLVDHMGGLEKVIEAALVAGLVVKARRAALAFGLIQAAEARTTQVVVAQSALQVAAINTVGAAAARNAAVVGAAGAGRGGAVPVPVRGGAGGTATAAFLGFIGWNAVFPNGISGVSEPLTESVYGDHGSPFPKGSPNDAAYQRWFKRYGRAYDSVEAARGARNAFFTGAKVDVPAVVSGSQQLYQPPTAAQLRQSAYADALLTPGTRDDAAALRALRAADQRALAFVNQRLASRKGITPQLIDQKTRLASSISGYTDQIAAILEADAAKAKAAAERAKAAKKKLDEQLKRAADLLLRSYRTPDQPSIAQIQQELRKSKGKLGVRGGRLSMAELGGNADRVYTLAELQAQAQQDLLTYGSNIGAGSFTPQGARAGLDALILNELREIKAHSRSTAHATSSIDRTKPSAIQGARALAGVS